VSILSLSQQDLSVDNRYVADIIALLVLSFIMLGLFGAWQHYLQSYTTYPPLMKLGILTRGKGRMTVINLIAFFEVRSL
jgi:hypothetical protein